MSALTAPSIRRFFVLSCALAGAILLTACISEPARTGGLSDKLEGSSSPDIVISSAIGQKQDGFLNLQIEFSNLDNLSHSAYWRIKWLDAGGFQIGGDESWKPVTVPPGIRQTVRTVSPTTTATDFRIQMSPTNPR